MSLFNIFDIAGSGMSAQSLRLNTTASNLANADSATSANGKPYKAKQVVFSAVPSANPAASGVKVNKVIEDNAPPKVVFDPKHPLADEKGYVTMPNVNVTEEMVNMIRAQRAFEANAQVMRTADEMLQQINSLIQ